MSIIHTRVIEILVNVHNYYSTICNHYDTHIIISIIGYGIHITWPNWYYAVLLVAGSRKHSTAKFQTYCLSAVPIMTAAAVTNVRWPQTPRKAIPVMGISGAARSGNSKPRQSKCHTSRGARGGREREKERGQNVSQKARRGSPPVSAKRAFWACTIGRAFLPFPAKSWTWVDLYRGPFVFTTLKNVLSFGTFAGSPRSMSRQHTHIQFP